MSNHRPKTGRPFNTTTPLGQAMLERGLQVKDVGFGTGINQRTLSDYLAGRKPILSRHCALLSEYLQVSPAVLLGRKASQGSRQASERTGNRSAGLSPSALATLISSIDDGGPRAKDKGRSDYA